MVGGKWLDSELKFNLFFPTCSYFYFCCFFHFWVNIVALVAINIVCYFPFEYKNKCSNYIVNYWSPYIWIKNINKLMNLKPKPSILKFSNPPPSFTCICFNGSTNENGKKVQYIYMETLFTFPATQSPQFNSIFFRRVFKKFKGLFLS